MSLAHDPDTVTRGGSLTPERFAQARAVFEAAIERPAAERRAYASGACANDEDLLREVQAMLAADAQVDPLLDRSPSQSPSSAPEEGRFPAGTILAGRYRVLGLLGRGGMGEVYRAFDLILNQTVALKFLTVSNLSEAALARFRNEVRIARQVSHPNVCRVYDLGMVEGLHFLSMEYIDGEDLSSLLRRIGRLPQDKAIEFTRKICAGLAAAHERGILHRDLKPANIMIDGRGQPRITDFGLAGIAAEIPLSDLRSGTPAYMSPEQKAGREVTARSDIYSLGLVLHEMFTGKAREGTQSNPSELVKDLDPALERLILRCLEEDPGRRPRSALSVAMGLPGGDPIAAALAAGETPSPEMIAASQEREGISPRTAWLVFLLALAGIAVGTFLSNRAAAARFAAPAIPPDGMAYRAREVLSQLGYPLEKTSAYGFTYLMSAADRTQNWTPEELKHLLASNRPAILGFFFRQTPTPNFGGTWPFPNPDVRFDSPVSVSPGMVRVVLDVEGRLVELEAQPPAKSNSEGTLSEPDWSKLFALAGLEESRFTPADPERTPPMAFDRRGTWTGTFGEGRTERVLLEAAAWKGRIVYFHTSGDWPEWTAASASFPSPFILVVLALSVFLAIRNLRSGRADRRGARNLAAIVFALVLLSQLAEGISAAGPAKQVLIAALSYGTFWTAGSWLHYIAVELYIRRHWPNALISWTRVQAGHFRDTLVASETLVGIAATSLAALPPTFSYWQDVTFLSLDGLNGMSSQMASAFQAAFVGILVSLTFFLLVVMVRLLVRRVALADGLAVLAIVILVLSGANRFDWRALLTAYAAGSLVFVRLWLLRRFGLWASMVGSAVALQVSTFSGGLGTWYGGRSVLTLAIPVGLLVWSLWVIVTVHPKDASADA